MPQTKEITAAKLGIVAYMAFEKIKVNRTNILGLLKKTSQIANELSIPNGFVQLALSELLQPRPKHVLEKLIAKEEKKLSDLTRRRLTSYVVSTRTDVANRNGVLHRITLLKSEYERSIN